MEIELSACPVESVTVFADRAEVQRRVEYSFERAAADSSSSSTLLLLLRGGSSRIDCASVRVAGAAPSAAAVTILEVSAASRSSRAAEDTSAEAAACARQQRQRRRVEELREARAALAAAAERVAAEKRWAAEYMGLVASHARAPPPPPDAATAQLAWYRGVCEAADARLAENRRETARVDDELSAACKELETASSSSASASVAAVVDVEVLLHIVAESLPVKGALLLSYIVAGAEWKASYDVRVASRDGATQLTYSASIINRTEEDWHDARLLLSTAAPAVGGEPPPLYTLRARLAPQRSFSSRAPPAAMLANPMYSPNVLMYNRLEVNDLEEDGPAAAAAAAATSSSRVLTARAERTDVCATFEIPRPATIVSDGKPHKLAIRVAQLEAALSCTAIPAKLAKAFLRAKCKNTAGVPLLPGEASVFVDGNFVCRSSIKETNPDEELSVFLGVDPSVVVDFKPSRDLSGESGILRRVRTREIVHRMSIKNTKSVPVEVWVFDQLPLSEDEKVKVRVIEPAEMGNGGVVLNEFNNIRWCLTLAPGHEQTVVLRYQIEWPKDRSLELV